MFKRCFFFLLLITLISNYAKSQPAIDTIKKCLDSKPQLFGKLDSRNSFISNSRAKVFGVKLGINYSKRLYFGIGYNQLYPPSQNFNTQIYTVNASGALDSVDAQLKLNYFSTHAEYAYFQTKKWDLSILLQLGAGNTYYQYTAQGKKTETPKNLIFIYEPAISAEYKIIPWVGVGADTGFRFVIAEHKGIAQKLNSPTYAFKLLIYYDQIYKTLIGKMKKAK